MSLIVAMDLSDFAWSITSVEASAAGHHGIRQSAYTYSVC